MKEQNKILSYLKEKFIAYYLPQAIGLGIGLGILILFLIVEGIILDDKPNYLKAFVIWLCAVPISTLFMGGIYHISDDYFRPRRINKLFKNKELIEIIESLGFELDLENQCFSGRYRNYYLTILIDSDLEGNYEILINSFIVFNENQIRLIEKLEEKYILGLDTEDNIFWITGQLELSSLIVPKIEKIQKKIDTLINDLEANNIEPLLVED